MLQTDIFQCKHLEFWIDVICFAEHQFKIIRREKIPESHHAVRDRPSEASETINRQILTS